MRRLEKPAPQRHFANLRFIGLATGGQSKTEQNTPIFAVNHAIIKFTSGALKTHRTQVFAVRAMLALEVANPRCPSVTKPYSENHMATNTKYSKKHTCAGMTRKSSARTSFLLSDDNYATP